MLSVLDPILHGPVSGFEESFGDPAEKWTKSRTAGSRGRRNVWKPQLNYQYTPSAKSTKQEFQIHTPPTTRKLPKISVAPRGAVGRSLDNIVEFSANSPNWLAEIELAKQRADVLRSSSQLVEAEVAALKRNQEAHRRLREEILAVFDAIFAEADIVFERHRQRLQDEAEMLRQRTIELEELLKQLTEDSVVCDDASTGFVKNYEQVMELLVDITLHKSVPCSENFGEDFQQAVKVRLAWRSSDLLLRDFRQQQQSGASRVFPCLLNLLAEVRSELLGDSGTSSAALSDETYSQSQTQTVLGSSSSSSSSSQMRTTQRLETAGLRLTDVAVVRSQQTLFYKPKFGVKRQRGWFGWSILPEAVLYGVCPGDGGSQIVVLSKGGQYLTGMRLSFDTCQAAGTQASRFDALHFSFRGQLLFLSDAPNNRILIADLCGNCRAQLPGLNQPRGAHHDGLNERLFVINSGSGTLEVFACPLYLRPQREHQQQIALPRLGKSIQHPGLSRISAVSTSLRCLYVTDSQLARMFVFANQLGFPAIRTVDLLPNPRSVDSPPVMAYMYFSSTMLTDGSEPELRTSELAAVPVHRPLYCANEAGSAFQLDELTVYFCHPKDTCIIAVRLA